MTAELSSRQQFLEEYRHIRHAEGRGSDQGEYYRSLPFSNQSDPLFSMWAMRAKTYRHFTKHILQPLESAVKRPLDILDLGAGNCWLSNRLSERQHRPIAIDIFNDERDGLRAARHYRTTFPVIESDFDQLPLPSGNFDMAIFNASLHYSTDYYRTLSEIRRCLRPSGAVVILDSPLYRHHQDGVRMTAEKHADFLKRYGFPSNALPSLEFLDIPSLQSLERGLEMVWTASKPWYGWRWHLRPLRAFVRRRRAPSKFWILTGRFKV